MWHTINLKTTNYPEGLTIYVDGKSIYNLTPIAPRHWPLTIDGTDWAEAAFDPPSAPKIDADALELKWRNDYKEAAKKVWR